VLVKLNQYFGSIESLNSVGIGAISRDTREKTGRSQSRKPVSTGLDLGWELHIRCDGRPFLKGEGRTPLSRKSTVVWRFNRAETGYTYHIEPLEQVANNIFAVKGVVVKLYLPTLNYYLIRLTIRIMTDGDYRHCKLLHILIQLSLF
jgi:hypothetical protein